MDSGYSTLLTLCQSFRGPKNLYTKPRRLKNTCIADRTRITPIISADNERARDMAEERT